LWLFLPGAGDLPGLDAGAEGESLASLGTAGPHEVRDPSTDPSPGLVGLDIAATAATATVGGHSVRHFDPPWV